ncbi:hypothetical protein BLA29_011523, partial [Euroglyphus maynei]
MNKLGESLKIRPKQCTNAMGEQGTCMFVWECIKTEGKHLGTCADGFLFGSCCGHNDVVNSIQNEFPVTSSTMVTANKDKLRPWSHRPNMTTTTT